GSANDTARRPGLGLRRATIPKAMVGDGYFYRQRWCAAVAGTREKRFRNLRSGCAPTSLARNLRSSFRLSPCTRRAQVRRVRTRHRYVTGTLGRYLLLHVERVYEAEPFGERMVCQCGEHSTHPCCPEGSEAIGTNSQGNVGALHRSELMADEVPEAAFGPIVFR